MNDTNLEIGPTEVAEIEKHKYFLSEKAGYDVGWQAAQQDWESNFAEQFHRASSENSTAHENGVVRTFLKRILAKGK